MAKQSSHSAFTLIELLIVIGIVGILSLVVILVINPADLLRQARDTTRLSDIDTLNHALNLYQGDVTVSPSFGVASTTYLSVADPTATTTAGTNCTGLLLPALGPGWSYHCAASSTLQKVDGTGWVPVNFTQISAGSPLGSLPVDPTNTTSSGNYYTYTPGGSWELTAIPESRKYRKTYPSAPNQPGAIINGSDLSLSPLFNTSGLVGYWNFDEGGGTSANDSSGNGNGGTLTNGPVWAISTLCKVGGCLSFDGSDDYVETPRAIFTVSTMSNWSISAWMKRDPGVGGKTIVAISEDSSNFIYLHSMASDQVGWRAEKTGGIQRRQQTTDGKLTHGIWHHVTLTKIGDNDVTVYVDGAADATRGAQGSDSPPNVSDRTWIGRIKTADVSLNFPGSIDDVRIYNRALSAAEVTAIYNATK